MVKNAYIKG